MMNDTYERHSRLLLRTYPPRYRDAREAELIGTLLDAAPPGATRPSMGEAWDIVRGGLLTRLRDRPPLHHWLAYRLFAKRVPDRYRMWVRDDALGRFHFLRRNLCGHLEGIGLFVLMMVLSGPGFTALMEPGLLLPPQPGPWILLAVLVLGIFNPLYSRRYRTRTLHKHRFAADGTELPALPGAPSGA
ncbi:hypothetical protein OG948_57870 (plasmid) [Embleya sp. NBC_00888]|uniref:hypothetical protein n=1 Tax=Embleya sp. NBC_00888 TaxID=2975960 RepID=UPI0038702967|nr:hypothetical protein OG948_57870 [Embleya sp. NBC_00888]